MKRPARSVTFPQDLFDNIQNIRELNNFQSFSETIVYLLQTALDSRAEINRIHFDQCHADYVESLVVLRKIATLLNTIIRNIYVRKIEPMEINFEQLGSAIEELESQMKEAMVKLDTIEKALNIQNQSK